MSFRVFVSSTFEDLVAYRTSVQQAVRQLSGSDISMEDFGARDERPLDECLRLIREESDFFVGIYAHRYGVRARWSEEVDHRTRVRSRQRASIPRFVYLLDESQPWTLDFVDDGRQRTALERFKARLKEERSARAVRDAGSQFTSVRFTERLDEIGARPSIGTVADSFDNALAETTNGLYKAECVRGPDAPVVWDDVDRLELETLGRVHWFNEDRLHSHCGDVPPAEFETAFYADHQAAPTGVGNQ